MESMCDRLKMDMELKNYSPHTQISYLARVRGFISHFPQSPEEIGKEEIRAYLYHLINDRKASKAVVAQTYSAVKFFYESTLGRDWSAFRIPRAKTVKKLPVVLTRDEVRSILAATDNPKYKAILATIYSGGLRISEAAHLKISDIDSDRMMIHVCHGKRGKDRYTLLARTTLRILRDYWKTYRPVDWLFPGEPPTRPITSRSIQYAFRAALRKTSIKKPATIHSLRHSFATHLVESDVGLPHIQRIMGHRSLRTTAIYLHVSRKEIGRITSPLDMPSESGT